MYYLDPVDLCTTHMEVKVVHHWSHYIYATSDQTHQSFPSVQLKVIKFYNFCIFNTFFFPLHPLLLPALSLHYNPRRTSFISFPSFNIYKLPPAKNLSSDHYMIYPSHPCQTMTKTVQKGGKVETNQPKTITKETEKERDDGKDLL